MTAGHNLRDKAIARASLGTRLKSMSLIKAPFDAAPLCSFGHGTPLGQWRAQFTAAGAPAADGSTRFEVAAVPPGTGQYQLEVRVYPWHPLLSHPHEMGLMKTL